ncbi:MAG: hypothetical protein ACK55I_01455, partial [bacterium]
RERGLDQVSTALGERVAPNRHMRVALRVAVLIAGVDVAELLPAEAHGLREVPRVADGAAAVSRGAEVGHLVDGCRLASTVRIAIGPSILALRA